MASASKLAMSAVTAPAMRRGSTGRAMGSNRASARGVERRFGVVEVVMILMGSKRAPGSGADREAEGATRVVVRGGAGAPERGRGP